MIALLALGTLACHAVASSADVMGDPLPDVSGGARLVVHNTSTVDVDVGVTHGSAPQERVGVVSSGATATFVLDALAWDSRPVVLVGWPVSGSTVAQTAPFEVLRGSTITFTLEPDLRRSYATVAR